MRYLLAVGRVRYKRSVLAGGIVSNLRRLVAFVCSVLRAMDYRAVGVPRRVRSIYQVVPFKGSIEANEMVCKLMHVQRLCTV